MNLLNRPPAHILASHPSMRIVNHRHDSRFYLGVIGMWHGDVDIQMLHKVSVAGIGVDFIWTAAAYGGDVTISLVNSPAEWVWSPEDYVGESPTGNLALTKGGGVAEHSAQAEAIFPATPKVPAAIVRNVYFAPDPHVIRSQPHHNIIVEWGLFEDGAYVDDVSRFPALVEELFR